MFQYSQGGDIGVLGGRMGLRVDTKGVLWGATSGPERLAVGREVGIASKEASASSEERERKS
jgi:hypothetical protein